MVKGRLPPEATPTPAAAGVREVCELLSVFLLSVPTCLSVCIFSLMLCFLFCSLGMMMKKEEKQPLFQNTFSLSLSLSSLFPLSSLSLPSLITPPWP